MIALSRFATIRRWPEKIYSDLSSQLVGAEKELEEAWKKINRGALHRNVVQNIWNDLDLLIVPGPNEQ